MLHRLIALPWLARPAVTDTTIRDDLHDLINGLEPANDAGRAGPSRQVTKKGDECVVIARFGHRRHHAGCIGSDSQRLLTIALVGLS